jgi:hypothetical protein
MDAPEQAHYRTRLEELAASLRQHLAGSRESAAPVAPDRAIGRLTRLDVAPDTFLCVPCIDRLRPS